MVNPILVRRIFVLILIVFETAFAQEGQLHLEPSSLVASESQLTQLVQEAVRQGGGNLDAQNLHLVIAIKTGFFKDDPVKAEAAREVASKLGCVDIYRNQSMIEANCTNAKKFLAV